MNPGRVWPAWLIRLGLCGLVILVTAAALVAMTGAGDWVLAHDTRIVGALRWVDAGFWGFVAFRLVLYALLFWRLPVWVRRYRPDADAAEQDRLQRRITGVLLRLIVVYELLFPWDVIGRLSQLA